MTRPSAPVGEKVIIVEGKTDCQRIQQLLRERVRILCTRGTLSYEK
ncbi:MAG: topoisomerase, partial [Alicyclobacillaceae bacterium]|nr:topoisomerase [Alicyclobacillaceae bacterium]